MLKIPVLPCPSPRFTHHHHHTTTTTTNSTTITPLTIIRFTNITTIPTLHHHLQHTSYCHLFTPPLLSDSQIAICTTTGAWASRKNKALFERNRRALAALYGLMARRCGSSTSERMPATE